MQSVDVGYVIARGFELLLQVPVDVHGIPGRFIFLVDTIATIGMVLAMLLLVMTVYVRIRLTQVEHIGFHSKEEEERMHHVEQASAAKNPRWEMVATLANSTNESDWRRAILEADIMLASLLTDKGYQGETVGEQLKQANPLQFTTLNLAWEAHKMRNAIAHLGDAFPLSERDVRATIDQYRRVFEEFSYI